MSDARSTAQGSRSLDRRGFCSAVGALLLGASCQGTPRPPPAELAGDPPAQLAMQIFGSGASRVVEVRWASAVDGQGVVNSVAVQQMLQAAIVELVGARRWATWAAPSRRVAIKVNSITSQAFTHPEVASTIAAQLVNAGCEAGRVTVWDRDSASLRARGYRTGGDAAGFRCLGSDAAGVGAAQPVVVAGETVFLSRLLLDSDMLISVAALKDHSMAGVSLTLKNNFGMIEGAERLHGDVRNGSGCEPGISALAALPAVRDRMALAVIDALVGVCDGGPGTAAPEHVFRYGALIVGRDPVAVDRRGLAVIEARRAQLGLTPIAARTTPNSSPPVHIDNAAARGVSPS